ncbi:hypothetical protein VKT23_015477 [Stygiomarasmius scandens]|uniref:Uncharacterized protein n=1 Tax=Marasmiellus scandens TaxID=2682957 RepID=A0ABR1IXS9_9AGAR
MTPENFVSDDAPPSYHTIVEPGSQVNVILKSPTPAPGALRNSSPSNKDKGKSLSSEPSSSNSSWWPFLSQKARETRSTIRGIIRDLESIEGHTPIYWIILNHPHSDQLLATETQGGPNLLTTFLRFTSPFLPSTIDDVRLACIQTSDHGLFRRLQMMPELGFAPLSGADEMILGYGDDRICDDYSVEDTTGDAGGFKVNMKLVKFQKRMKASKNVKVQFIAKGRMWNLVFKICQQTSSDHPKMRPGAWCVTLALMNKSPRTAVDCALIIPKVVSTSQSKDSASPLVSSPSTSDTPKSTEFNTLEPELIIIGIKTKPSYELSTGQSSNSNSFSTQEIVSSMIYPGNVEGGGVLERT